MGEHGTGQGLMRARQVDSGEAREGGASSWEPAPASPGSLVLREARPRESGGGLSTEAGNCSIIWVVLP